MGVGLLLQTTGPGGRATPDPPRRRVGVRPSFFDLLEAAFLAAYRDEGISLQSLRSALDFASKELGLDRPLLYHRFLHDGRDLELEYERDIAIRWWPLGLSRTVMIDPRFNFGRPVVASKKIRTEIPAERWHADEPIELIADDFRLSPREVEDALRFEVADFAAAA